MRKKWIILLLGIVVLFQCLQGASAVLCGLPPLEPCPDLPEIMILKPVEGETYNHVDIFTEVISNQEIDFWGYILNGGKYTSFTPNKTISYQEGENLLIVYGSNFKGIARDYVRFYVELENGGPEEPYCGDGVCNSEKGENWQNCPADCEKPSDNGDDDDEDDEGLDECCCCTSQGFVEYGKPFEEKKIIVSGNVVEDEPIVLNQRFKENKVNLGIWSIISIVLLILLIAMLVIWILEKR